MLVYLDSYTGGYREAISSSVPIYCLLLQPRAWKHAVSTYLPQAHKNREQANLNSYVSFLLAGLA